MAEMFTHKDLARRLKVSETTIKSYRRKFPDCIPVASNGKPIRFLPEAAAVCERIRDLFDLGMSVEEVRSRLSEEFSWISLIAKEEEEEEQPASGVLPQEFTVAISNMAKSMVTLLQQQSGIMDRMEKLERNVLDHQNSLPPMTKEGTPSIDFTLLLDDLQAYLRNALMPLQQLQRLNEVQGLTDVLHQAAANMVDAAQIMRSLADRSRNAGSEQDSPSKVVQFPGSGVAQASPAHQAAPQDPPRAFLLKPMVVRTMDGAYIGAGGKSRGRFTLNDFKALLVYGRQPGEHFSLVWEQFGQDWMATLTGPGGENSGKWRLHLKEAMSQSGVGIVELVGFMVNEDTVHPAEFVAFVGGLLGGV